MVRVGQRGCFARLAKLADVDDIPPPSAALAELRVYALSGLLLGMLGGCAAGMLLGFWRPAGEVLEPVVVGLNSLPRVALAPVLVIWFGLGVTSKIVVGPLSVFFIVFFNT
jgi:ABC-type nitrate/sulfonate/bicarbonate transport system permease component